MFGWFKRNFLGGDQAPLTWGNPLVPQYSGYVRAWLGHDSKGVVRKSIWEDKAGYFRVSPDNGEPSSFSPLYVSFEAAKNSLNK